MREGFDKHFLHHALNKNQMIIKASMIVHALSKNLQMEVPYAGFSVRELGVLYSIRMGITDVVTLRRNSEA